MASSDTQGWALPPVMLSPCIPTVPEGPTFLTALLHGSQPQHRPLGSHLHPLLVSLSPVGMAWGRKRVMPRAAASKTQSWGCSVGGGNGLRGI